MRANQLGLAALLVSNFVSVTQSHAESLTLDLFRQQVKLKDAHYRGAQIQSEGVNDANLAKDSITDARVFMTYENFNDKRPTQMPAFQGTGSGGENYSVGVEKQTEWGPSFSLSHNIHHYAVRHANMEEPRYYDVFPEFKATVPLWRNLLGRDTRYQLSYADAQADMRVLQVEIQMSEADAQVEMAFFTHLTNAESVQIHSDLLSRAEKIFDWVKSQRSRGLVDAADVHQAEAAVTLRRIDLEGAKNELQISARKFNDMRGSPAEEVGEELLQSDLDLSRLESRYSERKNRRDLLATQAQAVMQEMDFRSGREKAKPQLDLTFKGDWVGRDPDRATAYDEFHEKDQPYYYVGVTFSMTLDVPKYMKVRRGLDKMSEGQSLIVSTHNRDLDNDWHNFVDMGQRLKTQVTLLRQLEDIQKMKSDSERVRFQRGRSTTFQVLSFEQDYISARSRRIAAELEARRYITQLAMYK